MKHKNITIKSLKSQIKKARKNGDIKSRDYGNLLLQLAGLYEDKGDFKMQRSCCRDAEGVFVGLGDKESLAKVCHSLGNAEEELGNYREAADYFQKPLIFMLI